MMAVSERLDRVILTFTAYARDTGEPVTVDDRTFNDADHVRAWPLAEAPPAAEAVKLKRGKR
jgi:hypothetical protein